MAVTLVTGPVRSGKSRYVLLLAQRSGKPVSYVATAVRDRDDPQWEARLRRHAAERPASWQTIETAAMSHSEMLEIFTRAPGHSCVVVDALGTWLASRIGARIEELEGNYEAFEAQMDREAEELAGAMLASAANVIAVAEEVGWDVVPVAASARLFRDVLGRMKQRIAASASHVYLVTCGIAIDLRSAGTVIE